MTIESLQGINIWLTFVVEYLNFNLQFNFILQFLNSSASAGYLVAFSPSAVLDLLYSCKTALYITDIATLTYSPAVLSNDRSPVTLEKSFLKETFAYNDKGVFEGNNYTTLLLMGKEKSRSRASWDLSRPDCLGIVYELLFVMKKMIMLVDDDKDLVLLLRHVLNGKGYLVTTLQEGNKVLQVINSVHPDLLILDINIGEYDGRDICREIKQNPAYDHIPVVLFSALVKEKEAMGGCEADAYIEKPISTSSFLHKIESLIAA